MQTLKAQLRRWLDQHRIPYVDVDETKRALFAEVRFAALELIAYCPTGPNLLVALGSRLDAEAVESMRRWQEVFGPDFRAVRVWPEAGTWFVGDIGDPEDGQELHPLVGIQRVEV